MNLNTFWNGRITLALAALAVVAVAVLRNAGVSEVRRAHEPLNFVLVDPRPGPSDWPWARGVNSANVAEADHLPRRWSANTNLAWQSAASGRGQAAPCVWEDRLFLTVTDSERQTVSLLCLERDSGRSLWQSELHRGGLPELTGNESHDAVTPACDGRHVFVTCAVQGSLWVTAVDFNGRIAWQRAAGNCVLKRGYRSSPAIYKSLLIVAADNEGNRLDRLVGSSFLAALHRQTGEIIWRIRRPSGDSYGTPVVAQVAGRDQLFLAGKGLIASYDPATGDALWTCRWSGERVFNAVAFDDGHVFASTRHPQGELICIRADGDGDVTDTHVVWREKSAASGVTSPVVFEGQLYSLIDDGVLACLDATNGKVLWKRRLGGSVGSSPVIAGRFLYCCNNEGTTFVIQLGGKGEVIAENSLGTGRLTAPVVSGDKLLLRSNHGLHCLALPRTEPLVEKTDEERRRM